MLQTRKPCPQRTSGHPQGSWGETGNTGISVEMPCFCKIKNAFKGIDERLPIKWMPPHWKIWNQTSEWFLPVSDATLQFWLVAMLAPLGRGQDRIPQGTFSSWIRVFRACHVGRSPSKEHLLPSLEISLFCQDRSRSMLPFINQIYSLEGHKGRRGSLWKL